MDDVVRNATFMSLFLNDGIAKHVVLQEPL